jgi:hypothetical protein
MYAKNRTRFWRTEGGLITCIWGSDMSEKYPLWRRLIEEIFSQLIHDQWGPYVLKILQRYFLIYANKICMILQHKLIRSVSQTPDIILKIWRVFFIAFISLQCARLQIL